jgi:tRNA A-37 threonylcarbamoyl transferase component Bud32
MNAADVPPGTLRERALTARADYRDAVSALSSALGPGWSVSSSPAARWSWAWFRRVDVTPPTQGWKLHISTTPESAVQLLRQVLPRLRQMTVWFKLPDDLAGVLDLASGAAGVTQLGKVVTVYPSDDAELRAVVELIDAAWRPRHAPLPPHDPLVATGSALSMRYGAFHGTEVIVDAMGRPQSALRTPFGSLEPDRRDAQPAWAPDPPIPPTAHVSTAPSRVFSVSGRRYAAVRPIASRAGAAVYAAFDTEDFAVVLVRIASPGVGADELGHDAVSRLDNEARLLELVAGRYGAPVVVGYESTEHILITGDVGGRSLERLELGPGLTALHSAAQQLAGLHSLGLVHRDVKPANVVYDGVQAHFVDFELAALTTDRDQIVGGSAGYTPPGGEYAEAHPAADVYALGASLTHVLLGSCPGRLPRSRNRERQLALLRLKGHSTGAGVVERLTDDDATIRPTASQAAALLRESADSIVCESQTSPHIPPLDRTWARDVAREAGVATRAFLVRNVEGHHWRNAHHFADFAMQGVNIGAAGILLGLCTLDAALSSDEFEADVVGGAKWLASRAPYAQAHGLFTGNAGVAVALSVVARRHGQPDLLSAARARFVAASSQPVPGADLFSGAAGVVMAAITLAEIWEQDWPLELVAGQVARLHTSAHRADNIVGWPEGAGVDQATTFFGAAHGVAGVAMALAHWGLRVDAPRSTELAVEAFRGLYEQAGDVGAFQSDSAGRVSAASMWCHGQAGLSWCLEQLPDLSVLDDVRRWAANGVLSAGAVLSDPTLCHGTAGSLEAYRLLCDRDRAHEAAEVLRLTRQQTPFGSVWGSESPTTVTPDLWVGFLGPATQLALLSVGVDEPLISPSWLRRCVT